LPALPADSCFRLNVSHPETEISQWCVKITKLAVADMDDTGDLPADQQEQMQHFITEVLTLLAGGDAVSVGLAGRNHTPVVYLVKRYKGEMDFAARLDKLVKDSAAFATLIGEEKMLASRKYKISGDTVVTRVELIGDGYVGGVVDVVQRGNTVWLTIAGDPGRYMPDLLAAKGKTTIEPGISGYLDPPVLLEILCQDPSSPYHLMKADQRKAIAEKLGSKSVKWKTTFKDSTGRLDISVAGKTLAAVIEESKRASDKPEKLDEAAARKAEIAILDKRILQFKDWVPFYLKRARLRSRLGDHRNAIADATKAASLCPRSRKVLHRRAAERYFLGEYRKAAGDLDRAIGIKSDKAFFALTFSWHIARKAGDKQRLADIMKRIKSRLDADEMAGKKAWPRPMLSFVVGQIEAEKLVELAAKSSSAEQATAEAHYVIGMKHLFEGEKEKAVESLKACVKLEHEDAIEYQLAKHELKSISPPTTQSPEE
jgi:tetratricopeptide (TPR) repeat protein